MKGIGIEVMIVYFIVVFVVVGILGASSDRRRYK